MHERESFNCFSPVTILIIICAAAKFLIHMLTATNYGYFCDELYTLALSKHLAWGYVDLPPLVPALLALDRVILGESLFGIHILPALAGSFTLVFVCLITKAMGGKAYAIGLSGLAFIVTPFWLIMNSFFAYDAFDQLILAGFLYVLVKYLRSGNVRLWPLLGLLAGIACLAKTTILYLGPGFFLALLFSHYRKHLLTRWPWIGLGLFLIVISPYIFWQNANHWPTLDYWTYYREGVLFDVTIPQYFINIFMTMNPVLLPLLVLGLYRIFRRFSDTNYRFLGFSFLTTLVFIYLLKGKCFMLSELFIPLIAAGSIFIEELLSGIGWRKRMRVAVVLIMLAGGVLVAPSALPLLPPDLMTKYAEVFGFLYKTVKNDRLPKTEFPQEIANRIGWENLVKTIAEVYNSLPQEERQKAGIYTEWYEPAGAIDLLGPRYGLPHALSGFLTYHTWGPGEFSWEVMIIPSQNMGPYNGIFEDCEQMAMITNEHAMPYNTDLPVYVCRNLRQPIDQIWPYFKNYY